MKDILLNQKLSWPLTLLFWCFVIMLWVKGVTPWLAIILAVMHVTELFVIGLKTGEEHGYSKVSSTILCMMFGLFWWVPLRRNAQK